MMVATPGCRMRKARAESERVERSAQIVRVLTEMRPTVGMNGTITASGNARAVSIVSLVSMVRWNGPRVCAAPANGSTTPALKLAHLGDAIEPGGVATDVDRAAAGLLEPPRSR